MRARHPGFLPDQSPSPPPLSCCGPMCYILHTVFSLKYHPVQNKQASLSAVLADGSWPVGTGLAHLCISPPPADGGDISRPHHPGAGPVKVETSSQTSAVRLHFRRDVREPSSKPSLPVLTLSLGSGVSSHPSPPGQSWTPASCPCHPVSSRQLPWFLLQAPGASLISVRPQNVECSGLSG